MDKAKKNTVIHAAADRMAANYKSSQIPMYGDALRMPNRNAVIELSLIHISEPTRRS